MWLSWSTRSFLTLRAQKIHELPMQAWPDNKRKLLRKTSKCHNTCKYKTRKLSETNFANSHPTWTTSQTLHVSIRMFRTDFVYKQTQFMWGQLMIFNPQTCLHAAVLWHYARNKILQIDCSINLCLCLCLVLTTLCCLVHEKLYTLPNGTWGRLSLPSNFTPWSFFLDFQCWHFTQFFLLSKGTGRNVWNQVGSRLCGRVRREMDWSALVRCKHRKAVPVHIKYPVSRQTSHSPDLFLWPLALTYVDFSSNDYVSLSCGYRYQKVGTVKTPPVTFDLPGDQRYFCVVRTINMHAGQNATATTKENALASRNHPQVIQNTELTASDLNTSKNIFNQWMRNAHCAQSFQKTCNARTSCPAENTSISALIFSDQILSISPNIRHGPSHQLQNATDH